MMNIEVLVDAVVHPLGVLLFVAGVYYSTTLLQILRTVNPETDVVDPVFTERGKYALRIFIITTLLFGVGLMAVLIPALLSFTELNLVHPVMDTTFLIGAVGLTYFLHELRDIILTSTAGEFG